MQIKADMMQTILKGEEKKRQTKIPTTGKTNLIFLKLIFCH